MNQSRRLINTLASGLVFAAAIAGHYVTLLMPNNEARFASLQNQLAVGTSLALMAALIIIGPGLWRRWIAPVFHLRPARFTVFMTVAILAMWLPARKGCLFPEAGSGLPNDFPMMLVLFNKLAAGLWFALALAAFQPAVPSALNRIWRRFELFSHSRLALWSVAAIAGGIALAANAHLWDGIIRIPDEASYWLQGAMFSQGRLWLPAEPWSAAFVSEFNVLDGDKWYGAYPPGWPILLAAGWFAGAPSIVNPLLTAAIAALALWLARRHFSAWLAAPVLLMIAFSPWLWEEGMTYLSHSATLLPLMLGLAFLSVWLRRPSAGNAFAAALSFGWIAITRQLDAACLFLALGVWALFLLPRVSWRHRLIFLGALFVSGALYGALHLAYNAALTGAPLYFPLKRYYDLLMGEQWFRYGFGPDIGDLSGYCYAIGHTPTEGLWNAWVNVTVINGDFLGWPGGSLVFFWVWLFWGRKGALGRLMLALAAVLFVAYFFWWYHGLLTGSRYYFMLWILALWGTLGGLQTLARLGYEALGVAPAAIQRAGIRFVVASTALALLCYYPILWLVYYPPFFGIQREPWDEIENRVAKPALVFVEGEGFSRFAAPYCLNEVPPGGDVVWAKSRGKDQNSEVIAAFPGRTIYFVEDFRISEYERPLDNP